MTRINSNIPSLIARANLGRANEELDLRLQRLSTGLRINRGSDDPAGLIISERLRSDIEGVQQGIRNADRASNVIATTEGSLAEVNDLLNSIRALVVEAANTGAFSPEEIKANQALVPIGPDGKIHIYNHDGQTDVVVDLAWSGVSAGTERLLWSGDMPPFPGLGYPLVPGYESVGRVVEAGPRSGRSIRQDRAIAGREIDRNHSFDRHVRDQRPRIGRIHSH